MMNSLEILQHILKIKNHNVGVFPSDKIPIKWIRPSAFVINTDAHNRPGTHWVAIYLAKNGNVSYFNSLGKSQIITNLEKLIRKNCKIYRHNTIQLQSKYSSVCGQYCIMFLNFMSKGMCMDTFINTFFTSKLHENDTLVERYVTSLSKQKIKSADFEKFNNTMSGGRCIVVQCCKKLYSKSLNRHHGRDL